MAPQAKIFENFTQKYHIWCLKGLKIRQNKKKDFKIQLYLVLRGFKTALYLLLSGPQNIKNMRKEEAMFGKRVTFTIPLHTSGPSRI